MLLFSAFLLEAILKAVFWPRDSGCVQSIENLPKAKCAKRPTFIAFSLKCFGNIGE